MSTLRKKSNLCISILAIIIIYIISLSNAKQFIVSIIPDILKNNDTITNKIDTIETVYQDNFANKHLYANIYGLYQKMLSRQIIGNFEYIADEKGVIHAIRETPYNIDLLISNVLKVSEMAQENGSDFLYVQSPNRELANSQEHISSLLNIDNYTMDETINILNEYDINVLDERQSFLEDNTGIELKDIFLHTDLHMSTEAEMWAAKLIGNYLYNEFKISLNNLEYLSDTDKYYNTTNHSMLGNYGRCVGEYYTTLDNFTIYEPNFPTDYEINIWSAGNTKQGTFKDVVMNGYDLNKNDLYTYWITYFLYYGQPYYSIKNNNQSTGELLIITDSIGYRTISYLSLCCHEITILDPRFFNETNYIEKAFQDRQYDAVIIYQGTFLTDWFWNL